MNNLFENITNNLDIVKLMDNPKTPENELQPLIDILADGIDKAI